MAFTRTKEGAENQGYSKRPVYLSAHQGSNPGPGFPSAFLPATMITGVLGAVLLFQRTREN